MAYYSQINEKMAVMKSEMGSKIMDRIRFHETGFKRTTKWTHDIYPRCLHNNETFVYVLRYPAETSRTQWELSINELIETLIELRTNPKIIMD